MMIQTSNVELKEFPLEKLAMIAEVDRAETVEARYVATISDDGLDLSLTCVDYDTPVKIPSWSEKDIDARVSNWTPRITTDGLILGAFQKERLIGFACVGPRFHDDSAELVALFVDSEWRCCGIGAALLAKSETWARNHNIKVLFAESNNTVSSVGFYLKHGFKVITLNTNSLVRHRSGDPVLAKMLDIVK